MKKLNTFHFNFERLISKEDLKALKGGSSACWYTCECEDFPNPPFVSPFTMCAFEPDDIIKELTLKCSNGEGSCYLDMCI